MDINLKLVPTLVAKNVDQFQDFSKLADIQKKVLQKYLNHYSTRFASIKSRIQELEVPRCSRMEKKQPQDYNQQSLLPAIMLNVYSNSSFT